MARRRARALHALVISSFCVHRGHNALASAADGSAASALLPSSCGEGSYRNLEFDLYWDVLPRSALSPPPRQQPGCPGFFIAEPGAFARDGVRYACPPGTYSSVWGARECAPCDAGYRCVQVYDAIRAWSIGSASPTQLPCVPDGDEALRLAAPQDGDVPFDGSAYADDGTITSAWQQAQAREQWYCPPGSGVAVPAPAGFYVQPGDKGRVYQCERGSYCTGGRRYLCPAGTYGATPSLTTPACSGPCEAGYACPPGSSSPRALECGEGYYCPTGTGRPNQLYPDVGPSPFGQADSKAAGRFEGLAGAVDAQTAVELGTAWAGSDSPNAGTAGSGLRRTDGYIGSYLASETLLGAPAYNWPRRRVSAGVDGTPAPPATVGSGDLLYDVTADRSGAGVEGSAIYGPAGVSDETDRSLDTRTSYHTCPRGYYCTSDGRRHACPAGRAGMETGEYRPECSHECAPGYYCPAGSASPTEHVCGGPHVYCPAGSPAPLLVPPGYHGLATANVSGATVDTNGTWINGTFYNGTDLDKDGIPVTVDSTLARETQYAISIAPAGHWAAHGILTPCAPGRYGDREGLSTPACSGPCAPGYYCPRGSSSATANKCGEATDADGNTLTAAVYCPPGSGWPRPVSAGHYSVSVSDEALGVIEGSLDLQALYAAAGGGIGSSDPRNISLLSSVPQLVLAGTLPLDLHERTRAGSQALALAAYHFNLGSTGPVQGAVESPSDPRGSILDHRSEAQLARWFDVSASTLLVRSGELECMPGQYCVGGVRYDCPAGRYGGKRRETDPQCEGPCAPGYYCPAGSSSPTQLPCGSPSLYCPPGSPAPIKVPGGFYSIVRTAFPDEPNRGASPAFATATSVGDEDAGYGLANGFLPLSGPQAAPGTDGAALPGDTSTMPGTGNARSDVLATAVPPALVPGPDGPNGEPGDPRANWEYILPQGGYEDPAFLTIIYPALAAQQSEARAAVRQCPPGTYCDHGAAILCPAGTYGSTPGLTTPACSGPCEAGYYCPSGSSSATHRPCGNESVYCPPGSGAPIPVPTGYYSSGGRVSGIIADPSISDSVVAAAAFAPSDAPFSCTDSYGLFGLQIPAAARPEWPVASEDCVEDTDDTYTGVLPSDDQGLGRDDSLVPLLPVAGLPGATTGLLPGDLTGLDPGSQGFIYSQPAPISTPPVPAALAGQADVADLYSSGQEATGAGQPRLKCRVRRSPLLTPGGAAYSNKRRCVGGKLGTADTRSTIVQCEPGSFCWQGMRFECPPGTYGASWGSDRSQCDGLCKAGWYCPWASTTAAAMPCTAPVLAKPPADPLVDGLVEYPALSEVDPQAPGTIAFGLAQGTTVSGAPTAKPAYYCPVGSGAPTPLDPGHYWAPDLEEAQDHKTRQLLCPLGSWCPGDGSIRPCPAGTFGGVRGLSTATCSGPCAAGFFCPAGSSRPDQVPCGIIRGPSVYCSTGSASPLGVLDGWYTVGGWTSTPGLPVNTTRVDQWPCEPGHYCKGGVRYQCPAGTYGASSTLATGACSGPCAPGHFCPPGSVSPTAYRCGDAMLILVDVLATVAKQAALHDNKFNTSDGVTLADPSYSPAFLYQLYAQLAAGMAEGSPGSSGPEGGSGIGGTARSGAWRVLAVAPVNTSTAAAAGNSLVDYPESPPDVLETWEEPYYQVFPSQLRQPGDTRLGVRPGAASNVSTGTVLAEDELASPGRAPSRLLLRLGKVLINGTSDTNLTLSSVFRVSVPWRAGLRFRLPAMTVPLESFAAMHRLLLVGGAASLYCPVGSGWPLPVPAGYYSSTSDAALRAAYGITSDPTVQDANGLFPASFTGEYLRYYLGNYSAKYQADAGLDGSWPVLPGAVHPPHDTTNDPDPDAVWAAWTPDYIPPGQVPAGPDAAWLPRWSYRDATNHTRDTIAPAPLGSWAAAGALLPCQPGTYGNTTGLWSRYCSGWCPAGHGCPRGTGQPEPCAEGSYAPGGSPACMACPSSAPSALEPTNSYDSGEGSSLPPGPNRPPGWPEDGGEEADAADGWLGGAGLYQPSGQEDRDTGLGQEGYNDLAVDEEDRWSREEAQARAGRDPARPKVRDEARFPDGTSSIPSTPHDQRRCTHARYCCGL